MVEFDLLLVGLVVIPLIEVLDIVCFFDERKGFSSLLWRQLEY